MKKYSPNSLDLPILSSEKSQLSPKKSQTGGLSTKSGRGRQRALVLLVVHLIILAHISHYWVSGRSVSPVEPSESMYTIELGQLNAGAVFFGLAILSTAIFGRFFCGWGCHLVALQDLCGYFLRRLGLRPKPLKSRLLAVVPFGLAFYMFLWPTTKRLWQGEPHPGFSNHLMTQNFWYTFPGPVVSVITFVVCGAVIVYLLGNKGFCTYACPYGAFFSIADRLAMGRIRVTDACQHCGQCTAHCTSNVQVHSEVREFGMVVDSGCMKCMDCVSVCPNDALYFGLLASPNANLSRPKSIPGKPASKNRAYDFSMSEELIGLFVVGFTVFAVRGLYDITPLLLSVAIGVMTAYLTVQCLRLLRQRDLRVQSFKLKQKNQLTNAGRIMVGLLLGWSVFTIHSFFVQYHRHQGRANMAQVSVLWHELLAGSAQKKLTHSDHDHIDRAIRGYELSDQFGLLDVLEVKLNLAIGKLMKSDFDAAERFMRQAHKIDSMAVGETYREFLVSQDRQEEAASIQ